MSKGLLCFIYLFVSICYSVIGQSVIEVTDPADANIILLLVDKKADADIVIYKTTKTSESKQWDCMWLFKKWGFSDLSIFIYTDDKDTSLYMDEDTKYRIQANVFFTNNIEERGYKDLNFKIEGLIRKSYMTDSMYIESSKVLASANNDSILNLKNDSIVLDSTKSENVNYAQISTSDEIVFKVQVAACHRQIPEKELHKRYPGSENILIEMHDGWYKYLIGNFSKYSEAKQAKVLTGTPDAWIVVYKNGKRVHISEVINMLSNFPFNAVFIYMLT
ncbi:MAG: hypothetical protein HY951_17330 [Bacteroidia bacterium]|nr:hypothetical protein [Bacteroidia bacterium]